MPAPNPDIVDLTQTYSLGLVGVTATFANGTTLSGAGSWDATSNGSGDVLTASDLLYRPGLGAAVSVSVTVPARPTEANFHAFTLASDHWRYVPIDNVTPTTMQGDFALIHVALSGVPSLSLSVAPNVNPNNIAASTLSAVGFPASAGGTEMQLGVVVTENANTSTYDYSGPRIDAGYDGGALLFGPLGITRFVGLTVPSAGVVTENGGLAQLSVPMAMLINQWIAADQAGTTQQTGAIAVQAPALLHTITPDTGATGVNPAEAVLVDAFSYAVKNPDVVAAGMDPAVHFAMYGWHENRAPDPLFDVNYYLAHNPDVAAAGIDPLLHYAMYGWKEGRDPSAAFSTKTYLADNADVRQAGIDPLQHYLYYGVNEARTGAPVGVIVMPAPNPDIVDLTQTYSHPLFGVTATFANGTTLSGAGSLDAAGNGSGDVLTASDLLYRPDLGAAVSVSVISPAGPMVTASTVAADHWRYVPIDTVTPTTMQGDFALIHVGSGLPSLFLSVAPNVHPNAMAASTLNAIGFPASAGGTEMMLGVVVTENANTSTYDYSGPRIDAGYDGGALLFNPPGNIRFVPLTIPSAGVVTENGGLAQLSRPMATLINQWIAADQAGTTQQTGAIAVQAPALLHTITPDTGATGVNPAEAVLVDAFSYATNNPDVVAAGMDPAVHFAMYGWHENRAPDPLFDVNYYLAHNPDVAAAGIDPLLHYAMYGWKEGRDPSAAFSTKTYLADNADVRQAGIDPLQHYLYYGVNEARAGTPVS